MELSSCTISRGTVDFQNDFERKFTYILENVSQYRGSKQMYALAFRNATKISLYWGLLDMVLHSSQRTLYVFGSESKNIVDSVDSVKSTERYVHNI